MNLSINAFNYFDKKNYNQNPNFCGKGTQVVFSRPAGEIDEFISSAKQKLDGRRSFRVASGLCIRLGKFLGGKYLFELVDYQEAHSLWDAIYNNSANAMSVIENILKSKDSQGKTYNEIIDKMIVELNPKEKDRNGDSNVLSDVK